MAVSARRGRPLTPEEIHTTALRLIDEAGVERLSMRKLAAELDVNPMSLYHHVEDKNALLRGVCALVTSQLALPPDDGTPWQEQLRALARAYRSLALSHPSLWAHVSSHPDLIDRAGTLWGVYNRILVAAGVPPERLAPTRKIVMAFVIGFLAAETGGLLAAMDGEDDSGELFELATDLVTAALENPAGERRR